MVGDDAERNILLLVLAVLNIRLFTDSKHDIADGVDLEQIVNALHKTCKTLESHTSVDIRVCKTGISALSVAVELREYEVPELHEAVAVTAGLAVGLSAAVLLAAVKMYL